jgi:hypothetical protein
MEVCRFVHPYLTNPQGGYLFFTDVIFKPLGKWYSGNIRFQAFETSGYDTRLYAYENDLMFTSSTPSFFDHGVRYYFNLRGKLRSNVLKNNELNLSFKVASTVFFNKSSIGSGPSAIPQHRRSDIKLQVLLLPGT